MKFIYNFKIYDRNLFPTCSTEARKLLLLLKCRVSVNITRISLEHWKYTSSVAQTVEEIVQNIKIFVFLFIFSYITFCPYIKIQLLCQWLPVYRDTHLCGFDTNHHKWYCLVAHSAALRTASTSSDMTSHTNCPDGLTN